jgi:hypothetical protein
MSFVMNILKKKIMTGRLRSAIGMIRFPIRQWIFSIATKKLGLNIVTREDILKNKEQYSLIQFGAEESILVDEPYNKNPNEIPSIISSRVGKANTLNQPGVFEVINARLVGSTAVGFDAAGNLLAETLNPLNLSRAIPTRTHILKYLPTWEDRVDTACSIVMGNGNYFHWIADYLTRLQGLEFYQEQTGRKPTLIIDKNPTKWQIESLRLLGYEPENCLPWNGSSLKVDRLVIPSWRRERRIIPPSVCRWMRQRMLSNLDKVKSQSDSFSSRIYISRTKTTGRQVINEEEVLAALAPLGFVSYTMEKMSFADQVRLFSQAEIVVSPHGAALTNTLFSQNLSVIEFFGSYGSPSFFLLAKALGFRYACLASGYSGKNEFSQKYNGVTVDVARLQVLVEEMLSLSSDRSLLSMNS